ncbi:hypothetical protein Acid345_2120 [Candidatus Koribacter versatilis Ellin345]|uniref:DUF4157 domain-containing protein n=1 Tax=Koribacter versatilis (strain Ellin345) TaxID=204669 RepID=Q1IPS9_KORVE|nr:hypothetical protein [Candidatus Koribacter versatilis]ABF41121.1 hypothetical protein Acid345_2120 [Candidatus Koribacter versatilis Ellin345]
MQQFRKILALVVLASAATFVLAQDESLGDAARKVRDNKKDDVQVNKDDAKELFQSMNKIMTFASADSGFGRRTAVNHKMLGRPDVEKHFNDSLQEEVKKQRLAESQVVLQKFGLLPGDFNLETFLEKNTAKALGGFYDPRDKTMYLLNWIPLDRQKDIMAHELTHALQDQNYNIMKFEGWDPKQADASTVKMSVDDEDGERQTTRRAVIEGQAEVVHYDYILQPYSLSLSDGSGALELIQDAIRMSYDNAVVFKIAPRLLRDTSFFPYREGFNFELELLKKGGRSMAFSTPYSRPPHGTHEVLQPETYMSGTHVAPVKIPDLSSYLGSAYEAYDSGSMGELDVQVMAQEFGIENDVYTVARKWNGGAYLALKKTSHPKDQPMTTSDLALVYLSKWGTEKAATRMAQIYLDALGKRVQITEAPTITTHDCEAAKCPTALWEAHLKTADGPVNLEVWPKATLLITESLDDDMVSKLRVPLLAPPTKKGAAAQVKTPYGTDELAMRLYDDSRFADLAESVAAEIAAHAAERLQKIH